MEVYVIGIPFKNIHRSRSYKHSKLLGVKLGVRVIWLFYYCAYFFVYVDVHISNCDLRQKQFLNLVVYFYLRNNMLIYWILHNESFWPCLYLLVLLSCFDCFLSYFRILHICFFIFVSWFLSVHLLIYLRILLSSLHHDFHWTVACSYWPTLTQQIFEFSPNFFWLSLDLDYIYHPIFYSSCLRCLFSSHYWRYRTKSRTHHPNSRYISFTR